MVALAEGTRSTECTNLPFGKLIFPGPRAASVRGQSRVDTRNAAGREERHTYGPSIPDDLYRTGGAAVSQRRC
jgi:hypothetical protein